MASAGDNVRASEAETKIEDLRRLEGALHTASALMASQVKHEDVAIFIGTTRSGKSCLINYLIGNNLIGERIALCKPISIRKADHSPGPQIGLGSTSETIIPTRWNSQRLPGLGIWDSPGFDDNRGAVQDITNAFYIYELFKHVKSVKIVLVTDINDIVSDSIRPFLSLLHAVENLLKERMRECFGSIAVVFTKVPTTLNDNPVDMNFLNDLLELQFLSSNAIDMSEPSRDFVRFLIRNNQNIGFFRRAIAGPVTSSIDGSIISAIRSANGLDEQILRQVFPSIAHSSKVFLFEVREKLSSMQAFEELQNVVRDVFERKLNDYGRIEEHGVSVDNLHAINRELSDIRDQINNGLDPEVGFHRKVNTLQIIDPAIERLIRERSLLEKSNLMEFVDKLLDLKESHQFDFSLQGVMLSAMSKAEQLIISVKLKLGEITKKEAEAQVIQAREHHRQEVQKLNVELMHAKKQTEEAKKKIGFFGNIFGGLGCAVDRILRF